MPSDGPPGWATGPGPSWGPPPGGGWSTPGGPPGPPPPPEGDRPPPDGVARRTSALTVATGLVSMLGGALLLAAQAALSAAGGEGSNYVVLLAVGLGLAAQGVGSTLGWFMRTYSLSPDRLVIDEGVLTRHHRVIPFERVQQVDVSQDLLGQALGLAALRIDSAGEGATTVHLRLLEKRRADGLRSYVLERRAALQAARAGAAAGSTGGAGTAAAAPPPPERELLHLGPGQLALAVLAGPLAMVALAIALCGVVGAVVVAMAGDGASVAAATGIVGLTAAVVAGLVVLGVGSMVLNLWDLRVAAVGDDLQLAHGLLQVRALSMPRRRVQHVTIVDGPLQHALGIVAVTLHSAAPPTGAAGNQTNVASRFFVPYVPRDDLAATLELLLGGDWALPELTPRGPAARRRAVLRRALLGAAVGALTLAAGPAGVLVIVAGVAGGWLWGLGAHHRAGWAETPRMVVLAHGFWIRRTALVPVARVQSARATASPFQRRAGLATIHLDVAGGSAPSLYDLGAEPTHELVRTVPRRGVRAAGGLQR